MDCGYYESEMKKSKRCPGKMWIQISSYRKKINPVHLWEMLEQEHFAYLTKEQWSDSQDKVNFMEV